LCQVADSWSAALELVLGDEERQEKSLLAGFVFH